MSIVLDNVTFRYSTRTAPVIDGASLVLQRGESCALMGPSGEGKSTLLYLIAGLLIPESGVVRVEPTDPQDEANTSTAWVFQSPTLLTRRTALDNVSLALLASGAHRATAEPIAEEALRAVGLHAFLHYPVRRLSGGQAQRVALARAMVCNPALVLADEPTANLDFETGRAVIEVLLDVMSCAAVLVATHDLRIAKMMDKVAYLEGGKLDVHST